MFKRFENLGCILAEAPSCYCCAFYSLISSPPHPLLSSPPPLPALLLCVLDITSLLLLLLHCGLLEKVKIFCLYMYLIVLSRVQVLNAGGTPSLHRQCKATTETWGCRTPLNSMRHSSCLHPSAPPAAVTAVRHASPPRPRKHTAAPFKAPGGGLAGQKKLMVEKLWQDLFSDPSQWWDSRLGKNSW